MARSLLLLTAFLPLPSLAFVTPQRRTAARLPTSANSAPEQIVADIGTRLGPDTLAGFERVLDVTTGGIQGLYNEIGIATLFFVAIGVNGKNRVLPPPPPPPTARERLFQGTRKLTRQAQAKLPPIDVRLPPVNLPPVDVKLPPLKSKAVEDAVKPVADAAVTVYKVADSAARATPAVTKKLRAEATKAYAALPGETKKLRAAATKLPAEVGARAKPLVQTARARTAELSSKAGPALSAAASTSSAYLSKTAAPALDNIKKSAAPAAAQAGAAAAKYGQQIQTGAANFRKAAAPAYRPRAEVLPVAVPFKRDDTPAFKRCKNQPGGRLVDIPYRDGSRRRRGQLVDIPWDGSRAPRKAAFVRPRDGSGRRPSGDLARRSWLCDQEDGTSMPTPQESVKTNLVRPRDVVQRCKNQQERCSYGRETARFTA